ncbi:MAG: hypothetical protein FJX77_00820, partial [Armatimonadetes bacterium]|nr:hypothetical protein [Armatimonadota bacterium]
MPASRLSRRIREFRRNEWGIALILGYVALLFVPPLLALILIGSKIKPVGLVEFTALDRAQLARRLAEGHGFVTSVIRPLSVGFQAGDLQAHPDLYNPPLYPLLLSLFFRAAGASDLAVAGFGALLWVLTVWVTYFLARKWFGPRAALLATAFYGLNVAALTGALQGLLPPLLTLLMLTGAWLLIPGALDGSESDPEGLSASEAAGRVEEGVGGTRLRRRPGLGAAAPSSGEPEPAPPAAAVPADGEEPEEVGWDVLPLWRVAAAGIVGGLLCLTHYVMLPFLVGMALFLAWTQPSRGRALGAFAAGAVVVLAPWWIRNMLVGGNPLFSLYWYESLANSLGFSGEMIWRHTTTPAHPLLYPLQHPLQTLSKLLTGLTAFRQDLTSALDPVVVGLFLVGLCFRLGSVRWRKFCRAGLLALLVLAVAGSLLRAETPLLLAWAPFLAIGAAVTVAVWLPEQLAGVRWRPGRGRAIPGLPVAAATAVFIGTAALPLAYFILVARPPQQLNLKEQLSPVADRIPENGKLITDQPALVAWHARRTAIWLPHREEDLSALEQTYQGVDGAYVTAAMGGI